MAENEIPQLPKIIDSSRDTMFPSYSAAFDHVQTLIWQSKDHKAIAELDKWENEFLKPLSQLLADNKEQPEYAINRIMLKITDPQLKISVVRILFNTSLEIGNPLNAARVLLDGKVGQIKSSDNWSEIYEDLYRNCLDSQGYQSAKKLVDLVLRNKNYSTSGLLETEKSNWQNRRKTLYLISGIDALDEFKADPNNPKINTKDIADLAKFSVTQFKEIAGDFDYEKVFRDLIRYYSSDGKNGYFTKDVNFGSEGLAVLRKYLQIKDLNLLELDPQTAEELFGKENYTNYLQNRSRLNKLMSPALN